MWGSAHEAMTDASIPLGARNGCLEFATNLWRVKKKSLILPSKPCSCIWFVELNMWYNARNDALLYRTHCKQKFLTSPSQEGFLLKTEIEKNSSQFGANKEMYIVSILHSLHITLTARSAPEWAGFEVGSVEPWSILLHPPLVCERLHPSLGYRSEQK